MKDINEYLDAKTVIIIVLSVLILAVAFLSISQWNSMSEMDELIEIESLKNESYQREIITLKNTREKAAENVNEDELYKLIPAMPDEAGLIAGIDALCSNTSSQLRNITFMSRAEREGIVDIPFTVTMQSNYYSLVQFLEGIGTSERFILLKGLNISFDDEIDLLNVTIDASAFSYNQ